NHGYVTTSGATLTLRNFTGSVTLAAIDANTSTLTIAGARFSGWAFQGHHVGKLLYLTVGAYTLLARVRTYNGGQQVVLDNTGQTITPQTSVTGTIVCPAVDTTKATGGNVLIVEGMGQTNFWKQPGNVRSFDVVTSYGVSSWQGAVASYLAPNQITVSGSFPFAWSDVPKTIVWGTNDSASAIACALDVWPLKRRLWFSGDGLYVLAAAASDNAAFP